jgi:hypothetical protein
MPTLPVNHGSPYPSAFAAAQTSWYIDSVAGLDSNDGLNTGTALRTDRERAKRIGNLPLTGPVVVSLLTDLASDDYLTIPAIGPLGSFTVRGAAQTPLATGTLTGASVANDNVAATLADTGINWSSPTNLVKYRLRVTSGPRYGATAFLAYDVGSGVVEIAQAQVLDPSGYSNVDLEAGDEYVVEYLPNAGTIVFPYTICGAAIGGTTTARVILWDIGLDADPSVMMHVQHALGPEAVQFFGCSMGMVDGTYFAIGCSFLESMTWNSGAQLLSGCVIFGSALLGAGATASWQYGTYCVGGTGAHVRGKLSIASDIRCSRSSADGLTVEGSGSVECKANAYLRGEENTGCGLFVSNGTSLSYDYGSGAVPTITGLAGYDFVVSGTRYSWGTILYGPPSIQAVDGGRIVPVDDGPNGVALFVPFVPCVTFTRIPPATTDVGLLCQIGIHGPSLAVPANGVGSGFAVRFLLPWTYNGTNGIDVAFEMWLGSSLYFTICSTTIAQTATEGQYFVVGAASAYVFAAGVGLDIRMRVTNNDPGQTLAAIAGFVLP